ncbi:hypothetical protein BGX29_005806, partial [Mortierella sp. GBA35]
MDEDDLRPVFDAFLEIPDTCRLERMYLCSIGSIRHLPDLLKTIKLRELYLFDLGDSGLKRILGSLNLSGLAMLHILDSGYDWSTEKVLASR